MLVGAGHHIVCVQSPSESVDKDDQPGEWVDDGWERVTRRRGDLPGSSDGHAESDRPSVCRSAHPALAALDRAVRDDPGKNQSALAPCMEDRYVQLKDRCQHHAEYW